MNGNNLLLLLLLGICIQSYVQSWRIPLMVSPRRKSHFVLTKFPSQRLKLNLFSSNDQEASASATEILSPPEILTENANKTDSSGPSLQPIEGASTTNGTLTDLEKEHAKLKKELEQLEEELKSWRVSLANARERFYETGPRGLASAQARVKDYLNKKEQDEKNLGKQIRNELYQNMIPLVDGFREIREKNASENPDIAMIHNNYRGIEESLVIELEKKGYIEFLPELGDKFDPVKHSIAGDESNSHTQQEGPIVKVSRSGWLFQPNETVMRKAEVIVQRESQQNPNESESLHRPGSKRIFVGNIPWQASYQELKDHFSVAGPVSSVDVQLNAVGRSRGYGIIEYETAEDAARAIEILNDTQIRGRMIHVHEYQEGNAEPKEERTFVVENLPESCSWQQLKDMFTAAGCNVAFVDIARKGVPYGFVEFRTINDASIASRNWSSIAVGNMILRKPKYGEAVRPESRRKVYVGRLHPSIAWQDLKDHFRSIGKVMRADVSMKPGTNKSSGCGFVEFESEEDVARAIAELNNSTLKGSQIFVREYMD